MRRHVLLLLCLFMTCVAQAGEYKTYEETFTSKSREAYPEDINIWVYTGDFAKRFGMPEKWIDNDLKGAYAVAFRVETSPARYMFPHKGPDVSMPNRYCILDIFVDDTAKIPWVDNREAAISRAAPSAPLYLRPQTSADLEHRRRPVGLPMNGVKSKRALMRFGAGREDLGSMPVREYDRNLYPGITYISFSGSCVTPPKTSAWIKFIEDIPWENNNYKVKHEISIPASFMRRLYDNWYEKSRKPATGEWGGVVKTPSRKESEVINLPGKPEHYINKED